MFVLYLVAVLCNISHTGAGICYWTHLPDKRVFTNSVLHRVRLYSLYNRLQLSCIFLTWDCSQTHRHPLLHCAAYCVCEYKDSLFGYSSTVSVSAERSSATNGGSHPPLAGDSDQQETCYSVVNTAGVGGQLIKVIWIVRARLCVAIIHRPSQETENARVLRSFHQFKCAGCLMKNVHLLHSGVLKVWNTSLPNTPTNRYNNITPSL